jgi:hypothetical protein
MWSVRQLKTPISSKLKYPIMLASNWNENPGAFATGIGCFFYTVENPSRRYTTSTQTNMCSSKN